MAEGWLRRLLRRWLGSVRVDGRAYRQRDLRRLRPAALYQLGGRAVDDNNPRAARWCLEALMSRGEAFSSCWSSFGQRIVALDRDEAADLFRSTARSTRSADELLAAGKVALTILVGDDRKVVGQLLDRAASSLRPNTAEETRSELAAELVRFATRCIELRHSSLAKRALDRSLPTAFKAATPSQKSGEHLLSAALLAHRQGWEATVVHLLDRPVNLAEPELQREHFLLLGQAQSDRGKHDEAIDSLNQAVSWSNENDFDCNLALGTAWLRRAKASGSRSKGQRKRRRAEALKCLERARTAAAASGDHAQIAAAAAVYDQALHLKNPRASAGSSTSSE